VSGSLAADFGAALATSFGAALAATGVLLCAAEAAPLADGLPPVGPTDLDVGLTGALPTALAVVFVDPLPAGRVLCVGFTAGDALPAAVRTGLAGVLANAFAGALATGLAGVLALLAGAAFFRAGMALALGAAALRAGAFLA